MIDPREKIDREIDKRDILIKSHPSWEEELAKAKQSGNMIDYLQEWLVRDDVLRRKE